MMTRSIGPRSTLHGGMVVDGTGVAPYAANVLIENDRIVAMEKADTFRDDQRIDCSGCMISPRRVTGKS